MDSEDDSDDSEGEEPILDHAAIPHNYTINRIRVNSNISGRLLTAVQSENNTVELHELTPYVTALQNDEATPTTSTLVWNFPT